MSQLQQAAEAMPEYHTIQVFREADGMMLSPPAPKCACCSSSAMNVPTSSCAICAPTAAAPMTSNVPTTNAETSLELIPDDGIGGDWAMDVEMDATSADDVSPPAPVERRGSESTLYSFYFETPITTTQQQQEDDDAFTINSQETESFHHTEDLGLLQDSSSFWETGLAAQTADEVQRCISPAHVSLAGEEKQQPKQQQQQPKQPVVSRLS